MQPSARWACPLKLGRPVARLPPHTRLSRRRRWGRAPRERHGRLEDALFAKQRGFDRLLTAKEVLGHQSMICAGAGADREAVFGDLQVVPYLNVGGGQSRNARRRRPDLAARRVAQSGRAVAVSGAARLRRHLRRRCPRASTGYGRTLVRRLGLSCNARSAHRSTTHRVACHIDRLSQPLPRW